MALADDVATKVVALLLAKATGMKGGTPAASSTPIGGNESATKGLVDFAQRVTQLLVPISIAAAVFGAATSGMQPLIGAIKIAGMVLGTVLTPFLVTAAAVVLTLADVISDYLIPNLEQFYTIVITGAVEAIGWMEGQFKDIMAQIVAYLDPFGKAIEDTRKFITGVQLGLAGLQLAIGVVVSYVRDLVGLANGQGMAGAAVGNVLGEQQKEDVKPVAKSFKDAIDGMLKAAGLKVPTGGGSFTDRLKGNLGVVSQQMRQDMMPKAGQSDLAGAKMNALMTSLNMTEFERKSLEIQVKQLDALDAVVGKLRPAVGD